MIRILVTGRNGQIARALVSAAPGDMVVNALGRPELDITDYASIEHAISCYSPDVLVNAAALTSVDFVESDEASAFSVNCQGAGNAAAAAAAAGIPIIHLSTDYVFSGEKRTPYREDDRTQPINVYGRSKLAGEEAVARNNPAHVILRTSWVYSPWGTNFVRTMLRLAGERPKVRVVADQYGAPTYAPDIADGILLIARRALVDIGDERCRGVFHVTGAGATNWAGFAEAIFASSAALGGPVITVEPITSAEYPTPARRPANSLLDNTRYTTAFARALPEWRDGVKRCVSELYRMNNHMLPG